MKGLMLVLIKIKTEFILPVMIIFQFIKHLRGKTVQRKLATKGPLGLKPGLPAWHKRKKIHEF